MSTSAPRKLTRAEVMKREPDVTQVVQYDPESKIVFAQYRSVSEAAEANGVFPFKVHRACYVNNNTINGQGFLLLDDLPYEVAKPDRPRRLHLQILDTIPIDGIKPPHGQKKEERRATRAVVKVDPATDEVVERYPSVYAAADANGLNRHKLRKLLNGRGSTTRGWSYRYA